MQELENKVNILTDNNSKLQLKNKELSNENMYLKKQVEDILKNNIITTSMHGLYNMCNAKTTVALFIVMFSFSFFLFPANNEYMEGNGGSYSVFKEDNDFYKQFSNDDFDNEYDGVIEKEKIENKIKFSMSQQKDKQMDNQMDNNHSLLTLTLPQDNKAFIFCDNTTMMAIKGLSQRK